MGSMVFKQNFQVEEVAIDMVKLIEWFLLHLTCLLFTRFVPYYSLLYLLEIAQKLIKSLLLFVISLLVKS